MFNLYPYMNLNDLNLDYILNAIREMRYEVTNFVSINAIKYADPIQWDITRQYEKNTIVINPITGTAYISVAPVPSGVALTRPEYWTVVFDLGSFVTKAAKNFTDHYEESTTLTATFNSSIGDWLVWGDVLYKALVNITAGDAYVVGSNIDHFTIEDLYNAYLNTIANILAMIGDLVDLNTADKSSIVNAINEVVAIIGDLTNLTTSDKTSVVNAINEVNANLAQEIIDRDTAISNAITALINNTEIANVKEYGALGDNSTDDTLAIKNAIATGKSVYFPRGQYVISDTLIIGDYQVFFGDGMYSSILKPTFTDKPVISGADTAYNSTGTTPLKNAKIAYIGLSMVHVTRTTPIMLFNNAIFCELDHVYVINGLTSNDNFSQILFRAGDYNIQPSWVNRIHDCHFHMVRVTFDWSSDNYFYSNYINCVALTNAIQAINGSGTMFENNQILGELDILNSSYLIITGNYFDAGGTKSLNYQFFAIAGNYLLNNIVIANNRFYQTPKCAIVLDGALNGIDIVNNICEDCDAFAQGYNDIQINQTASGVDACMTISGNKHRHVNYWDSDGNIQTRTNANTNGSPYHITNDADESLGVKYYNYLIVRDANVFQAANYVASVGVGRVKFVSCTPEYIFPNGARGMAIAESAVNTVSIDFSGGNVATAHIDYKYDYANAPIPLAMYYSNVATDYFYVNVYNATSTGFDIIFTRNNAIGDTFTVPVAWLALLT